MPESQENTSNRDKPGKENMLLRKSLQQVLVFGLLTAVLCSCSMFRRGDKPSAAAATDSGQAAVQADTSTGDDVEARLKSAVTDYIKQAGSSEGGGNGRLIRKDPYFLREYVIYPDGAEKFEVRLRETESRTAPYLADVVASKQRFATQLHRKKEDAKADGNLFRSTGTETMTYELRNGRWVRTGSLFVAKTVEENVNGEWVPVEEKVQNTLATEERPEGSWLGRAWSSISGR